MKNKAPLLSDNSKPARLLNQAAQLNQEKIPFQRNQVEQKIHLKIQLNFYKCLKNDDPGWKQTRARLKTYGLTNEEIKVYIQDREQQIEKTKQQLAALS